MYHKQTIQKFLQYYQAWPTNGVEILSPLWKPANGVGILSQITNPDAMYIHPDTFALCCVLDPRLQHSILQKDVTVYFRNWMPDGTIVVMDSIDPLVLVLTDVSVLDAI